MEHFVGENLEAREAEGKGDRREEWGEGRIGREAGIWQIFPNRNVVVVMESPVCPTLF